MSTPGIFAGAGRTTAMALAGAMSYSRSSSWASVMTCEGEVMVGMFTRISAS